MPVQVTALEIDTPLPSLYVFVSMQPIIFPLLAPVVLSLFLGAHSGLSSTFDGMRDLVREPFEEEPAATALANFR